MVGQVKEFGAEFQTEPLGNGKLFEKRKIETMEPRATEITRPSAKGTVVGLADRGRHGWSSVRRWIQPLVYVMRTGVGILARNSNRVAAESGSSGRCTRNGSRLPVLQSKNPVRCPSPEHGIHNAPAVMQILSSFTNRQVVASAQVKYFINVKVAPAVVRVDTEARQERCSISRLTK